MALDWDAIDAEIAGHVLDSFGSHTITLTRKTPGSLNTTTLVRAATSAAIENVPAERTPLRLVDGMTQCDYTVKATAVGGVCPAKGDIIQEGAVVRTIVSVSVECGGHLFVLGCSDKAATR